MSLEMGRKVLVINAGDHLKVIPLPPDPLKTLHGAFNTEKPFRELRSQAEQAASPFLGKGSEDKTGA